jgi:hypothetical protein
MKFKLIGLKMLAEMPLTLALSPSDGEREFLGRVTNSLDRRGNGRSFSLSLSEMERAGERVFSDCIDT